MERLDAGGDVRDLLVDVAYETICQENCEQDESEEDAVQDALTDVEEHPVSKAAIGDGFVEHVDWKGAVDFVVEESALEVAHFHGSRHLPRARKAIELGKLARGFCFKVVARRLGRRVRSSSSAERCRTLRWKFHTNSLYTPSPTRVIAAVDKVAWRALKVNFELLRRMACR